MVVNNLVWFLREQRYFPTLLFFCTVSMLIAMKDMAIALLICGGKKDKCAMYLLEDLLVSGVFFLCVA